MNHDCKTCGKTFRTARELNVHVSKAHNVYDMYGGGPSSDSVAGNGYTTCKFCGQAFDSQFYVSTLFFSCKPVVESKLDHKAVLDADIDNYECGPLADIIVSCLERTSSPVVTTSFETFSE
jgi:hypothetical protein